MQLHCTRFLLISYPAHGFFMFSYGSYITGLNFACFQEGGERLEDVSCSGKTKKLQIFLDKIAVISDTWLPVCGFIFSVQKGTFLLTTLLLGFWWLERYLFFNFSLKMFENFCKYMYKQFRYYSNWYVVFGFFLYLVFT